MLGGCRLLTDGAIKEIARYCGHSLRKLELERCQNITNEAVYEIFSLCASLEVLSLENCTQLTDHTFDGLDKTVTVLRELKLNNCSGITDVGVVKIAESCRFLQVLEMKYCNRVSVELTQTLPFPSGCKVCF
eukprot:c21809_g1_i3 orf=221-616(-)